MGVPERIGTYQVLKILGKGGMGEVFLAQDPELERHVAIKRLRIDRAASHVRSQRFETEAKLIARVDHPSVVRIYHVLNEAQARFIVMEYVEGTNLRQLLEDGPLALTEGLSIAQQVAEGMAHAHGLGIVHRDLKTENILIRPPDLAKITDFGIAKRVDAPGVTEEGKLLGTCRAMSPEQAFGKPVDYRSDLFSFGVLLYEMFGGSSPFLGPNEAATLINVIQNEPVPLGTLQPGLPEDLLRLVDHLLQKEPHLRPRSFDDVAQDLWQLVDESSGAARRRSGEFVKPIEAAGGASEETWPSLGSDAAPVPAVKEPETRDERAVPSQVPPENGRPALPESPAKRRSWPVFGGVLGVLLLVVLGAAGVYWWARPQAPVRVAVLEPKWRPDTQPNKNQKLMILGLRQTLTRGMTSLAGVEVLEESDVDRARKHTSSLTEMGRQLGVDVILKSELTCQEQTCHVRLDKVRSADGINENTQLLEVPIKILEPFRNAILDGVYTLFADLDRREGEPPLRFQAEDYARYLALLDDFQNNEPHDAIREELAKIRKSSPDFIEAYLLEADVARAQHSVSQKRSDIDHARGLLKIAQERDPADLKTWLYTAAVAYDIQDYAGVEQALTKLAQLSPDSRDPRIAYYRAWLLFKDDPEVALKNIEGVAQRSQSDSVWLMTARLQHNQGHPQGACQNLQKILRADPQHPTAWSDLARWELEFGQPKEAVKLYRKLINAPPYPDHNSNLGRALLLSGRTNEALEQLKNAYSRESTSNYRLYFLAEALQIAGDTATADSHYRKLLKKLERRSSPRPDIQAFHAVVYAQLGQNDKAKAYMQKALKQTSNVSTTVAYDAATAYALVGEVGQAEKYIKLLRDRGQSRHWFQFSWFRKLPSLAVYLRPSGRDTTCSVDQEGKP